MPFFGVASRLDKIQFGFHAHPNSDQHVGVDHSRVAVSHAQHVANLFVDEARLSANHFDWTNDEQDALLQHHDVWSVSLPGISSDDLQFSRSEMYLF
jgi:hypothetical protein